MRVYWSRPFLLSQLILMLGLDVVLFISRIEIPMVILAAGGIVFSAISIACLWCMILRKPVLTIDEAGFIYHRHRLPIVHWDDVLSVERLPRVQRGVENTSSSLREAWRPSGCSFAIEDRAPPTSRYTFSGWTQIQCRFMSASSATCSNPLPNSRFWPNKIAAGNRHRVPQCGILTRP